MEPCILHMKLCIQHMKLCNQGMHPRKVAVMLAKQESALAGGASGVKQPALLSGDICFHCKCLTTQARSGSQPSRYVLSLHTYLANVRSVTD